MKSLSGCVLALMLLVTGIAHAQQEPTPAMRAAAREAYEEGVAAARDRRWPEARDAFQRSYDIYPRPITLMNLAGAQAQTGQLVAAAESYRRFLRTEDASVARYREDVSQALAALEARIGRRSIEASGLRDGDELMLDGAPFSRAALASEIRIDPGAHVVAIARGGSAVAEVRFEVAEGSRDVVRIAAPVAVDLAPRAVAERAIDPAADEPIATAEQGDDPTPWIIVGVSAGVLAVAAAIVVAVVVTSEGPGVPGGNIPPIGVR